MKKIHGAVLAIPLVLSFYVCAFAQMQGEDYRITTSVISGGGAPTGSANYQTDPTLGQPSPLMDPYDPTFSPNYNLEPGFWYTLKAAGICEGDFEPFDGDVDGSDLATLADTPFDEDDLATFALEFGRDDCL